MGAFNLVRNGLALFAGVALLDVIFEEFGDSPSPKYSETDSERRYRENVDKMAEMKVDAVKEKMEKVQKLAEEKKQQYDELTKEVREMLIKVSKMVEDRVSDDDNEDEEVVVEDEITNEENSEAKEPSNPLKWMGIDKNVADETGADEAELTELRKRLAELENKLKDKILENAELKELQKNLDAKTKETSEAE